MDSEKYKIATIQATPVFMNREATVDKACRLIKEAADNGAKLALLPEAFIPGYPDWIWMVPAGKMALNQSLYGKLLQESVTIPSEATDKLCATAKANKIFVVVGVNERNTASSGGSIFNTLLYIDDEGNILGHHQKLVPTLSERTIWAYGDPGTLKVYDTRLGVIGGLICWENYMPLARYSLYSQGISLYNAPTYDESETWQGSMKHIAREGRTYVMGCCMAYKKEDILSALPELEPYYEDVEDWVNTGNSVIVDPDGTVVAGPLLKEEGILYAEVNRKKVLDTKWNLDVAGHYARPDVFKLTVQRSSNPVISWDEEPIEEKIETVLGGNELKE